MPNISEHTDNKGQNTAIYIVKYTDNTLQNENVKKLVDGLKKNNLFNLYIAQNISSETIKLHIESGAIEELQTPNFAANIKNIIPINVATVGDVNTLYKWLAVANKSIKTVIVANNIPNTKANALEKWSGYWSNFWSKFFSGSNANLANAEWVLIERKAYETFSAKKINNA